MLLRKSIDFSGKQLAPVPQELQNMQTPFDPRSLLLEMYLRKVFRNLYTKTFKCKDILSGHLVYLNTYCKRARVPQMMRMVQLNGLSVS